MDDQKQYMKAVDAVGDAFANLVAVAFTDFATLQEAVREMELVLAAMHGTLTRCAIEAAMKKKNEMNTDADVLKNALLQIREINSKRPHDRYGYEVNDIIEAALAYEKIYAKGE